MQIKSLKIEGFRSFKSELLIFQPTLTLLVGENNAGKSAIGIAIKKLFTQAAIGNDMINQLDYPYGREGPLTIEATLELAPDELSSHFIDRLVLHAPERTINYRVNRWLLRQGSEVNITLKRPSEHKLPHLKWGELQFYANQVSLKDIREDLSGSDYYAAIREVAGVAPAISRMSQRLTEQYTLRTNIVNDFGKYLLDNYKPVEEYRLRPDTSRREAGVTESMNGSQTPNVLLTLKNHPDPSEKTRYKEIVAAFHTLFSQYAVDAVESEPGSNIPDVQFYERGRAEPLSLDQMSSGAQEILTLITNLIAREGLIVFLEHPELHLHPHSIKWLGSFLTEASKRNQIIVVTHDPYLIDPKEFGGVRRFWWILGKGTKVCAPQKAMSATKLAQVGTALRDVGNREVIFARCTLLVEDESLHDFLIAVAPTLGHDLNASGVSVISTGGHGGHQPFHTLLDSLGIPHVNLRDKSWGNNAKFPPSRFFSLGAEFEEYIDGQGLAEIRSAVVSEAGGSHRRQAALLGEKLSKDKVPKIFNEVLRAAVKLATGKPS